ncbi:MAG: GntR family transcriptional regulator [Chitinivibrionales bacterium]|nr:GntR family transcriptional regulator [Chitinivibrionales bacterium]MBD3396625.1 GntR family transcriptional regulator [Chitinivibrionales bacterium]
MRPFQISETSSKGKYMSRILFREVAKRVYESARENGLAFLDPVAILCAREGVSTATMLRAVHLLRDQGKLRVSPGQRMQVLGANASLVSPHAGRGSAGSLALLIEQGMREGRYRVGDPLPKARYFSTTQAVSYNTVCAAMRLLAAKGLLHKRGKHWVVGAPLRERRVRVRETPSANMPSVLLLVGHYDRWKNLFSEHLFPMLDEFTGQLYRAGMRVIPVFGHGSDSPVQTCFPTGRAGILDLINSLGSYYRGTCIAQHYELSPDLKDWIDWLAQFNGPVVWIDFDNAHPDYDRGTIGRRTYYRCSPDENQMVRLAVSHLATLGHRRIVYPRCVRFGRFDWEQDRLRKITDAAGALPSPIRVDTVAQNETHWMEGLEADEDPRVKWFVAYNLMFARIAGPHAGGSSGDVRSFLHREFASMRAIVDGPATAIIAANQWLAMHYYTWLTMTGMNVPRDMSLIAFDNYSPLSLYPITTLDLRLEDLGYKAAHVFVGDIPVGSDRRGNVRCTPVLVDRGSVGRPRRER